MTQPYAHGGDVRDPEPEVRIDAGVTEHTFDKPYWEQHWQRGLSGANASMGGHPANPYIARETADLTPGVALDAGCGAGAEAIWLATAGWQVVAVDISQQALARAAERAAGSGVTDRITWVEADLTAWSPDTPVDLVTSHYAHPAMPQLAFYDRIAQWVRPGGSLLIVAHLHLHRHDEHVIDDGSQPITSVSVTAASIIERLDAATWQIITADECTREMTGGAGQTVSLYDVVVRAIRRR